MQNTLISLQYPLYIVSFLTLLIRSVDEIKNEIVKQGGLEELLKFKDNPDFEVQSFVSIGFAYLSQTEENKEHVGKYLNFLIDIINGDNKMLIHQCLMAIANISTLGNK